MDDLSSLDSDPEAVTPSQDSEESSSSSGADNDSSNDGSDDESDATDSAEDDTESSEESTETTGIEPIMGDVEIQFSTVSYGGRYKPRNSGAAWIETAEGQFLITLELWANRRLKHVVAWNAASGGDSTDVMSGATLSQHTTHQLTWDRFDAQGVEHMHGDYVLRIEFTEVNSSAESPGPNFSAPFTIGGGVMDHIFPGASEFSDVVVTTPG